MPFRFGIATLTDLPLCLLILRFRFDESGESFSGISSDLLPPKWFKKDPNQPANEELDEMKMVIRHAVELGAGVREGNPFQWWAQLATLQREWADAQKIPHLLANFGVSLVERALLDAFCRRAEKPFAELISTPELGIKAEKIHRELKGATPRDLLPSTPLKAVLVRHTLGFGDPLTEAEISPDDRLPDPLPQSLESAIRTYGLTHFKIKIKAESEEDRERLEGIAAVLEQQGIKDYALSLDGNEMFTSWGQFSEFWLESLERPRLRDFLKQVIFIEQPLSRQTAFQEDGIGNLPGHKKTPPVIIDESDGGPEDFETALSSGYSGVSHKNCKGVFKGIAHRMLIEHRCRRDEKKLIMTGEDLGNIGPVALQQDLTLQAILGNASVERNGHHYFYGMSMFPEPLQALVGKQHPELYRKTETGIPTLRIEKGMLSTEALLKAPLGLHYSPEDVETALNLR